MILTLFWTVAFCLGLYTITQEGQLLYFLRKPFDNLLTDLEVLEERLEVAFKFDKSLVPPIKRKVLKYKFILYIAKPIIHCITCLSSVWGVVVFIHFNGLHYDLIPAMILNSVCAAFIQTFIWNLYVKYIE